LHPILLGLGAKLRDGRLGLRDARALSGCARSAIHFANGSIQHCTWCLTQQSQGSNHRSLQGSNQSMGGAHAPAPGQWGRGA
jgi:hypothetical protein